jgi:hypothetical protein
MQIITTIKSSVSKIQPIFKNVINLNSLTIVVKKEIINQTKKMICNLQCRNWSLYSIQVVYTIEPSPNQPTSQPKNLDQQLFLNHYLF